jgi:hypothetical protein
MHANCWSTAVLVLLACAPAALADVLVVDAAGGGDYTSVDVAAFFAADGDTLLVRPILPSGQYVGAFIVGKSLTLVGDPQGAGVRPRIEYIAIEDLAASQRVVLRGLDIHPPNLTFSGPVYPGVYIDQCEGAVWIEDCEVTGQKSSGVGLIHCFPVLPGGDGLFVNASSGPVTVVRCALTGGMGAKTPGMGQGAGASDGGAGASLSACDAAFFECMLSGGTGGDGLDCSETGDGGAGVRTTAASVLVSGGTVTGGEPGSHGVGGAGLAGGVFSTFELLDTTLSGGTGGQTVDVAPGTITGYAGSARSFALDSPLREGEAGTLLLQGSEGDFVGCFWSFGAGSLPMPARNGWFLLDPAQLGGPFFIGFITDPGGTWDIPVTAPLLPPGLQAQTFLMQAWFQYPGGVTLASGTAVTLLDQGF